MNKIVFACKKTLSWLMTKQSINDELQYNTSMSLDEKCFLATM